MDDEHVAAGVARPCRRNRGRTVVLVVVEPDPVLDRHRIATASRIAATQPRDQRRLGHQARAEAAGLHALGRAAAVEVDLVVAPALAELARARERAGSLPPSWSATGCSAGSKSRWRGTSPCSSAAP
jgi:hypothetical protein